MSWVRGYLLLAAALLILGIGSSLLLPEIASWSRAEGSLVENLTAGLFFIGFVAGLALYLRRSTERPALMLALTGVCLISFLDEISFGFHFFDFEPATVYGKRIDAAHDYADVALKLTRDLIQAEPVWTVLGLILLGGITVALALRGRRELSVGIQSLGGTPRTLLVAFALFGAGALLLDLDLVDHSLLVTAEELFEMNAALSLGFCVCALGSPAARAEIGGSSPNP